MENEEPKCTACGRTGVTITSMGLCFACLAKKHEDEDDESSWMNKG